jgi:hypothetical protein
MAGDAVRDLGGATSTGSTGHGRGSPSIGTATAAAPVVWTPARPTTTTRSAPGTAPRNGRPPGAGSPARLREENQRRIEAGEVSRLPDFARRCPTRCDELDDWSGRPVHACDCPCSCDLG